MSVRPMPEVAAALAAAGAVAREMGVELYLVGGAARACIEEQPIRDLDLVVARGDGQELARRLAARLGGAARLDPRFLAAHLELPSGLVADVTTARRERYPRPAALPVVEPATLEEDLRRRDFTVNAFAVRVGDEGADPGAVIDPLDGLSDLRRRSLRVLHDRSFVDDPTRVLRAVRLEVEQGFRMATETEAWARQASFAGLSGSRLREELRALLSRPATLVAAVERLDDLGVLVGIDPALRLTPERRESLGRLVGALAESDLWRDAEAPAPWLAALAVLSDEPERLARRIDLSGRVAEPLERAAANARRAAAALAVDSVRASEVDRLLASSSGEELALLVADDDPVVRQRARRHVVVDRRLRLTIRGSDLVARGVRAGPAVGEALARTREARLDERIGPADELAFALASAGAG